MGLVSPRLKALSLPPILFSITLLGLFTPAISRNSNNPLFWGSFILFFLIGAFLFLPEDPIPGKRRKTRKVGFLTLAGILYGLLLASHWVPEATIAGVGFVGLPSGAGVRGLFYLLFQARWDYCPKCEQRSWIDKRDGKWYCLRKGHVVNHEMSNSADPTLSERLTL